MLGRDCTVNVSIVRTPDSLYPFHTRQGDALSCLCMILTNAKQSEFRVFYGCVMVEIKSVKHVVETSPTNLLFYKS